MSKDCKEEKARKRAFEAKFVTVLEEFKNDLISQKPDEEATKAVWLLHKQKKRLARDISDLFAAKKTVTSEDWFRLATFESDKIAEVELYLSGPVGHSSTVTESKRLEPNNISDGQDYKGADDEDDDEDENWNAGGIDDDPNIEAATKYPTFERVKQFLVEGIAFKKLRENFQRLVESDISRLSTILEGSWRIQQEQSRSRGNSEHRVKDRNSDATEMTSINPSICSNKSGSDKVVTAEDNAASSLKGVIDVQAQQLSTSGREHLVQSPGSLPEQCREDSVQGMVPWNVQEVDQFLNRQDLKSLKRASEDFTSVTAQSNQNAADMYSGSHSPPGNHYTSLIVQDVQTHQEPNPGTPTGVFDQVIESTSLLTRRKDLIVRDSAWLRIKEIYAAILQFLGREQPLVEGKARV